MERPKLTALSDGGRHPTVVRHPIVNSQPPNSRPETVPGPRERLVESGWQVIDNLPLSKAFAGAASASVAEAAGVTTGSFFHHFANSAEFSDALVLAFDNAPQSRPDQIRELFESLEFVDLLGTMRATLNDIWTDAVTGPDARRRLRAQMRLWSHNHLELSTPVESSATVADILRKGYVARENGATTAWEAALQRSGREMIAPFTVPMVATAITSLFEGLLIRHAVDPESVDPGMFGNIAAAITDSLTGPAGIRARVQHSAIQLTGRKERSPQARSGARRRHDTRARIIEAATGMFTQGWEQVSAAEIAERAEVSSQTVLNLFGGVRGVAAATFAPHAIELYSLALERPDSDPREGLTETLQSLAIRVAVTPQAARALLAERLATSLRRGSSLSDMDVRVEVPLAGSLALWLSRMGVGGDEGLEMATMLANFVLTTAMSSDLDHVQIVDLALRLIPSELLDSRGTDLR